MTDRSVVLRGLCEHARELELGNAILEAANAGEDLRPIQDIIVRRLKDGTFLRSEPTAHVLAAGPNKSLWDLTWTDLKRDLWSVLVLYGAGYPKGEIETALCQGLYRTGEQDDEPRRRFIVEAMAKVGSSATLPTLTALLEKLTPRATTVRNFGESLSGMAAFKGKSAVSFVDLLIQAIAAIKARSCEPSSVDGSQSAGSDNDGVDKSRARQWLTKAHAYAESDPIGAVDNVRKGAEALAKSWCRALGKDQGKDLQKLTLEELTSNLAKGGAPGALVRLLKSCQPMGNFSAHDQDNEHHQITPEIASHLIDTLELAMLIEKD